MGYSCVIVLINTIYMLISGLCKHKYMALAVD